MIDVPKKESSRIPRWLIHDEENRTFIAHTHEPRFFAELVDEAGIKSFVISLGEEGDLLCEWIDEPIFDEQELIQSCIEAIVRSCEE